MRAGFALVSFAMAGSAWGVVSNQRLYRLGEDDPLHPVGAPGSNQTIDNVSAANANKIGLEFYHSVPSGGGVVAKGIAPGSAEAMEFTNVDSRYVATPVAGLTNYGLEAYVQLGVPTDGRFFYNGGNGFPLSPPTDGLGLGIQGGQYVGIVGGVGTINSTISASVTQPVEIAIVADSTSTRLFVQGVQVGPILPPPLPVLAADVLAMGNFQDNVSPPLYGGVLDEARVFTFLPGQFNPGDLGPAAVPEPGVIALVGAVASMALRRRNRQ